MQKKKVLIRKGAHEASFSLCFYTFFCHLRPKFMMGGFNCNFLLYRKICHEQILERRGVNNMRNWLTCAIYNFFGSAMLVSLYLIVYLNFRFGDYVQWVVLHWSSFMTYVLILFVLFVLVSKYQMKLVDILKRRKGYLFRTLSFVYAVLFLILLSVWMNMLLQYHLQLKDMELTLTWITEKQKLFRLGAFYLFLIGLLYFAVTGRMYIGVILLLATCYTFALVIFNKMSFLGVPLFPSDFRQMGNFLDIASLIQGYLSASAILYVVLAIIVIILFIRFITDVKMRMIPRLVVGVVSMFFLYSFTYYPTTFMNSIVNNEELNITRPNQVVNYQRNGFVLSYIYNLNADAMERPSDYSEQRMREIVDSIVAAYEEEKASSDTAENHQPHIIYLMNETFWDPTRLPVEFSEDPMPNVREYMEKYPSGNLLAPTFGGGTANVEYEAITGFSMSALKSNALPYQQIVDRKPFIPSIVSLLNEKEYESIALHSFTNSYFKRPSVYQTFNFQEFISMDEMKYAEVSGKFVSDESVTNEIIHLLNERENRLFIHAVTMQNHFPYREERYEENTVGVTGLSDTFKLELEVFTEGIKQADAATKKLLDYLDEYPEPVMVVFWGDHLPILGEDKGLYREVNYANINTVGEDYRAFHETPLFVYANFELPDMDLKTVSTTFLGPIAFELAGLAEPPFYWFLNQIRKEVPGLSRNVKVGADGRTIDDLTEEQEELLKMYEMIQYDLLLGRQYSKDRLYYVD